MLVCVLAWVQSFMEKAIWHIHWSWDGYLSWWSHNAFCLNFFQDEQQLAHMSKALTTIPSIRKVFIVWVLGWFHLRVSNLNIHKQVQFYRRWSKRNFMIWLRSVGNWEHVNFWRRVSVRREWVLSDRPLDQYRSILYESEEFVLLNP